MPANRKMIEKRILPICFSSCIPSKYKQMQLERKWCQSLCIKIEVITRHHSPVAIQLLQEAALEKSKFSNKKNISCIASKNDVARGKEAD